MWFVYILASASRGTLYTGITNEPVKRLAKHNAGTGAKYTRGGSPWELIYLEEVANKSVAAKREHMVKKMKRTAKLKLAIAYLCRFQSPSSGLLTR